VFPLIFPGQSAPFLSVNDTLKRCGLVDNVSKAMLSVQITAHKCHYCGKRCRSAGGLGRHLKKHVGECLPATQVLQPVPNFISGSSISTSALPSMFSANIITSHEGNDGEQDRDDYGRGVEEEKNVEEEKSSEVAGEMEADVCEGNDWRWNEARAGHKLPDFSGISHRFLDYGRRGPMARLRNLNPQILQASQVLFVCFPSAAVTSKRLNGLVNDRAEAQSPGSCDCARLRQNVSNSGTSG
jgi:hypothetical protein